MTFKTKNYSLDAFTYGEYYSSAIDRKRFNTIDSQLALLADLVGNGIISGWTVSVTDAGTFEITITDGMGIIDRFVTRTFGPLSANLSSDTTSYIYLRRKEEVIGGSSAFSNLASVVVSDTTAPAIPSALEAASTTFNTVSLRWTANNEADFSHYIIERSLNNIDFSKLDTTTSNSYTDIELDADTIYYYRLKSVDLSDNTSSATAIITAKTSKDTRVPLNAQKIRAIAGNESLHVSWAPSPSSFVSTYSATIQEINAAGDSIGQSNTQSVDANESFIVFRSLVNESVYKISLHAVSEGNISSEPVNLVVIPSSNNGPHEIERLTVTFVEASSDNRIAMLIQWNPFESTDPYLSEEIPSRYIITILENGEIISEPIIVDNGITSKTLQLIPFKENGLISFRGIKEDIDYFIKVQAVDSNGNVNNGIVVFASPPSFETTQPPSDVKIQQKDDLSLLTTWHPSSTLFLSHYRLTISRKDLSSGLTDTPVDDIDVGKSTSYLLASSLIVENSTYTAKIIAINNFSSESIEATNSITINGLANVDRPNPPQNQLVFAGDGLSSLSWSPSDSVFVTKYRIWRADYELFLNEDNFSIIETVNSSISIFDDFTVENGKKYAYFITSIDLFGQESLNPVDDNFIGYTLLIAEPTGGSFKAPDNLTISQSGFDAVLNWTATAGEIDGYEIYKSIGNKYDFKFLDAVKSSITNFTDEDALLVNGIEYNYLVRKFRNEAEIFVTESTVVPAGSVIVVKAVVISGNISLNTSVRTSLAGLDGPVRKEAIKQIKAHKHALDNDGNDRRINLHGDILIDDWITNDFRIYSSKSDISGSSSQIVSVIGTVNEEYFTAVDNFGLVKKDIISIEQLKQGVVPFLVNVDVTSSQIIFEVPLFSETETAPFLDEPQIILELKNVQEVQGTLQEEKIESVSATQATSGLLSPIHLPELNHEGRLREKLNPKQIVTETNDQFLFFLDDDIGTAITFYDVISVIGSDSLIAATSKGLYRSNDFGSSWEAVFTDTTSPVSKIFYSNSLGKYLLIASNRIYSGAADLTSWAPMKGLEGVHIVRDLIEDPSGKLYISTDIGVLKLTTFSSTDAVLWETVSLLGHRSTETYALLFDINENRLLVSNELGLFESKNTGTTWDLTTEFGETEPIFSMVQDGSTLFALTKDAIWRKKAGDFIKVADLDVDFARKIIIFKEKLYITTENGLYVSDDNVDIFIDDTIRLKLTFVEMKVKNTISPPTSLNTVGSTLFAGTYRQLFSLSNKFVQKRFDQIQGIIPTIYVNKKERKSGYIYSVQNDNVLFDEAIDADDIVTITNHYKEYTATNKGWTSQKYDSKLILRKNNKIIAISGDISINASIFSNFQFPIISERNSHLVEAEKEQINAENQIAKLVSILDDSTLLSGDEHLFEIVAQTYKSIERFLSQVFETGRVVLSTIPGGVVNGIQQPDKIIESTLELPFIQFGLFQTDGLLANILVNATTGKFVFEEELDYFDDLDVDLLGVTIKNTGENKHNILEDSFELVNSGLYSSFSRVQQSNILKLGLIEEKKWKGSQLTYAPSVQSFSVIPRDQVWYDRLNSTVDYMLQLSEDDITISLPYASTAIYLPTVNVVLVGGKGGILSIDASTLDMTRINFPETQNVFVKKIKIGFDEKVYALTHQNIYVSEDYGVSWSKLSRTGLPNKLFTMAFINNIFVIGGIDGVYIKGTNDLRWSKVIESNMLVNIIFDPDMIFAIVDNQIYFSNTGSVFTPSGKIQKLQINELTKHKGIIFAATNVGLYRDDASFYGINASLTLANTLGSSLESKSIIVNDVSSNGNKLLAALHDGSILSFTGEYVHVSNLPLDTAQLILHVDNNNWIFGYDKFVILNNNDVLMTKYPFKLSTGVPI